MSDLKESTVTEHLLKLSRQRGSTGEPYQQNVPRLKLPFVPYDIVPEDSPNAFDEKGRLKVFGAAATPSHSRNILPTFIFRSLAPEVGAAPDTVQAETSFRGDRAALNVGGERSIRGTPYDMNYIKARVGPLSLFGTRGTGPEQKTSRFGGSANVGPVTLYAEKEKTAQTVIPEQDRRFFTNPDVNVTQRGYGVRGSVPMGRGTLSADLSRRSLRVKEPQFFRDPRRPERRNPDVTELRGEYEGKFGPGILGLRGLYRNFSGKGTGNEFEVFYNADYPIGFGGRLTAQGTYANPYGAPSEAQGTLRYTLPLGGPR